MNRKSRLLQLAVVVGLCAFVGAAAGIAGSAAAPSSKAKKGTSTFGSYSLEVENAKGVVKLHAQFELAVTRVHPQDYAAFRAFLSEVDKALGQRLIVKP